jgi:hypothetical protein
MIRACLKVLLLAATLASSGCYRATFYRDPSVSKGETHDEWTNFYVFGLVGSEKVDVRPFCPGGDVAAVQTGGNFVTGLVSVVTIGIYTPRKVYVTCPASTPSSAQARWERSAP